MWCGDVLHHFSILYWGDTRFIFCSQKAQIISAGYAGCVWPCVGYCGSGSSCMFVFLKWNIYWIDIAWNLYCIDMVLWTWGHDDHWKEQVCFYAMLYYGILSYRTPSCSYTFYASESICLLQMHQIGIIENRNRLSRSYLVHIPVFKEKLTILLHPFWHCWVHCKKWNTEVSQCAMEALGALWKSEFSF